MNFLSALKTVTGVIGGSLHAIQPALPYLSAIPGPFGAIFTAVSTVETLFPKDGGGALKKEVAAAMIKTNFPDLDAAKVSTAIDMMVALLNFVADKPKGA